MDISEQTALVTGGGSGLGRATARRLASLGAKVAILDYDAAGVQAVADEIGGVAVQVDVSDERAVASAVETALGGLGQTPKIAVSCAGIGLAARIVGREGKLSTDVFEKTMRVNLFGTYYVMSHVARAMANADPDAKTGERGVIINTSSVAWQDGQLGQAAYAASKGAIASLCLPAAREFSRAGIRVMAIAPGLFETAMTETLPDDVRTAIAATIPFPSRLGFAEEYAQLVEQIVCNPFLNGTTIRLDGAVRLPPR